MKLANIGQTIKSIASVLFLAPVLLILLVFAARGQNGETQEIVASGGAFTLEKAVVAGGGGVSARQTVNQNGTTGQSIAGHRSTGGNFSIYSGFWTPEFFTPTAANVTVGGRVKTADGRGIRNVLVTITFPSGEQRTVLSSAFGYYRFAEVPTGATYVFRVAAKRYTFNQPTQIRSILDETQDIDFIAAPQNSTAGEIPPQ